MLYKWLWNVQPYPHTFWKPGAGVPCANPAVMHFCNAAGEQQARRLQPLAQLLMPASPIAQTC